MQRVTGDGGAGTGDDEPTKPPHAVTSHATMIS